LRGVVTLRFGRSPDCSVRFSLLGPFKAEHDGFSRCRIPFDVANDRKRRYGWRHQEARKRVELHVRSGKARCAICDQRIAPAEPWDLHHIEGAKPWEYAGPAHRRCNRATPRRGRLEVLPPGHPGHWNPNVEPDARPCREWSEHWWSAGYRRECQKCRRLRRACPEGLEEAKLPPDRATRHPFVL
jgi:hypothetical protein